MKFTLLNVYGLEEALFGMREPLDSHDKSTPEADKKLAVKLLKAGEEHAKFARMIHAYVRIEAPLYWWKEFDTYRMGVEKNSGSTMHTITRRPLAIQDFEAGYLRGHALDAMTHTIETINALRHEYMYGEHDAIAKKEIWYQIIQLLPSSFIQTRTVDVSYAALRRILKQRKGHKLMEWAVDFRFFCKTLPDSWILFEEEAANE